VRRYADLADLTRDWSRMQIADLLLLLRAPLAWYRQQLIDVLATAPRGQVPQAALSQLRIVYDTMEQLRRHGNRQLALDAMLMKLQGAARQAAKR
jgi:hypothetical protein